MAVRDPEQGVSAIADDCGRPDGYRGFFITSEGLVGVYGPVATSGGYRSVKARHSITMPSFYGPRGAGATCVFAKSDGLKDGTGAASDALRPLRLVRDDGRKGRPKGGRRRRPLFR